MNTYPSSNITKAKVLAMVAAGSLILSACVGPHRSKVSVLVSRRAAVPSVPRYPPGPVVAARSYLDLYYQTVPPARAIYVRTWARESLAYNQYEVFGERAVPQGTSPPDPSFRRLPSPAR